MAILRATIEVQTEGFAKLAKLFPELSGRMLSLIGKRARTLLKKEYLSGQEITLRAFPRDRAGRFTISSDVNKRRTQVKIYSYPANLFERGRMLRSGRKEKGRYIITRKLKQAIASRVATYAREAEQKIYREEMNKL